MALPLKKFREIVFQLLYSRDFEESDWEEIIPMVMRQLTIPKRVAREGKERAEAIWQLRSELDEKINGKANDYEDGRIPRVERSILRMGLYELSHTDVPPKVVIAEAIRLTRKFATRESGAFINAILDALHKESEDATISEELPVS